MKHATGVLLAGALAFGAVFAASAAASPVLHGNFAGSSPVRSGPTGEPVAASELGAELIGLWRAPLPANQDAFVEFDEQGLWHASDGCNRAEGTWSVEPSGEFDGGESGVTTQIWCDNVPIPTAVWGATRATVTEQGQLKLTSQEGESTTLERGEAETFHLIGTWSASVGEPATVEFTSDGKWRGIIGCGEFTGTWILGMRDVIVLEDDSAAPDRRTLLSTPASLVIGPQADGTVDDCESGPTEFVLSYDTEYRFEVGTNDAFTLTATDSAPVDQLVFVRD